LKDYFNSYIYGGWVFFSERVRDECRHKNSRDSADMETEEFGVGIGFTFASDSLLLLNILFHECAD